MTLYHKPSVVMNGLVMYVDTANSKSWVGQPTTNLCSSNGIHTSWNNSGTATWGSDDPYVPRLFANIPVISMYKDTAGNSHIANGYSTLSAGLAYTVSMYVYIPSNAGTLAGSVPYMRTFPANTGRGELLYNGSNAWNTWPKDRWIRISNTFTNSANDTEHYISCYLDNAGNKIYMTAPMVEQKSILSTYQSVGSTRSNTQALRDLTNNNTLTVNSLTYASNGTFSFNGTSDYISVGNSLDAKTIIAWVKLSTSAGGDYIVYGLDANGSDNWFGINGNLVNLYATQIADVNNFSIQGTTSLNTANFYQICGVIDGQTARVFLNGVQENSITQSFTIGAWNSPPTIGRRGSIAQRYFPGIISTVSVYNRALTNTEIQQNFNALRGRYGL